MGIFDFIKKKNRVNRESHYDATNIRVTDIEKDYILDYDLDSWIVTKMFEYDWGNNFFTREFLINNGKESRYLHIEEGDEIEICVTEKIGIRALGPHIKDILQETGKPPGKITYDNVVYYLDSENPGYYRNVENEDWYEVISWLYLNEKEDKLIHIEQRGEDEFEATIGIYIEEYKISNILPQNTDNE